MHDSFKFVQILIYCLLNDINHRLVLIADKDKVYNKFPTPLINRLEKHYLTISTILTKKQENLMIGIEKWVNDFSKVSTTIV